MCLEHHVGLRQPGGAQAAGLAVDHQRRVGVGRGGVQLQQDCSTACVSIAARRGLSPRMPLNSR